MNFKNSYRFDLPYEAELTEFQGYCRMFIGGKVELDIDCHFVLKEYVKLCNETETMLESIYG